MDRLIKVVAAVLLAPFVLLIAGIGGCEARKAYYDWKVRKMCEQDGGVIIFERTAVSPELFASLPKTGGRVGVPPKAMAGPADPIYATAETKYLREGSPQVWRTEYSFIRRADGKLVGRAVFYSRMGGDFPSHAHPSSFGCPAGDEFRAQIEQLYLEEKTK